MFLVKRFFLRFAILPPLPQGSKSQKNSALITKSGLHNELKLREMCILGQLHFKLTRTKSFEAISATLQKHCVLL